MRCEIHFFIITLWLVDRNSFYSSSENIHHSKTVFDLFEWNKSWGDDGTPWMPSTKRFYESERTKMKSKKKRYRRSQAHAVNEYFAINYLFNVIGCWKTDHKFGCNVEFAFYKYHSGIWSKFYFFMFTGFRIWQIPRNRTWSQSF